MNPSDNIKFDSNTNILTIEPFDGVEYLVDGKPTTGSVKLTRSTTVRARPRGRLIDKGAKTEFRFEVSKSDSNSNSVDTAPGEVSNPNPEGSGPDDVPNADEGVAGNTPESPAQQAAKVANPAPNRFPRP